MPRKESAFAVTADMEIYIPLEGVIDISKEMDRLNKQLKNVSSDLDAKNKKLSNRNFMEKADPEVVEEQKRLKEELSFKLEKIERARKLLEG